METTIGQGYIGVMVRFRTSGRFAAGDVDVVVH